ncbi:MAG: ankyrin repeat domain-containing protein [Terriglobia bacterium]
MGLNTKTLTWGAMAALLAAATVSAAADLRLVEAVKQGDRTAVRSLLAEAVDVNAPQGDGATALAWAAHRNDLEAAELLMRAGADANIANDYGVTPLSLACTNGNAAMVAKLLEAGANPSVVPATGETVLMTCARAGSVDAVKSLLARGGADVNAQEKNRGQTALMWAVAAKHAGVARVLLEHGADVNARSRVLDLFRSKRIEYYGKDVHYPGAKGGFTPLLFAARVGDLESARVLLEAGANVNDRSADDGSALVVASASGHQDLALFLLEKGANPKAADAMGITALHWALQEGLLSLSGSGTGPTDRFWHHPNQPQLARALVARGADPNARIQKEFHPYSDPLYGHNMGNDLPQISIVGATPFLLAVASADLESMRFLVEGRADPRMAAADGTTPLMVAAGVGRETGGTPEQKKKFLEAAKAALQLGGDVKAVGGGGRTVLHGAALLGDPELIRFLVEQGADLNAKDKYGQTPLTIALGDPEGLVYRSRGEGKYDDRFRRPKENKKVAELLLELGAAPFTGQYRDRSGE